MGGQSQIADDGGSRCVASRPRPQSAPPVSGLASGPRGRSAPVRLRVWPGCAPRAAPARRPRVGSGAQRAARSAGYVSRPPRSARVVRIVRCEKYRYTYTDTHTYSVVTYRVQPYVTHKSERINAALNNKMGRLSRRRVRCIERSQSKISRLLLLTPITPYSLDGCE